MTPPPFQRFLDEQREPVWRFLVASVGREHADDCFQETFISALRAYPKLRDAENLRGIWEVERDQMPMLLAMRRRGVLA